MKTSVGKLVCLIWGVLKKDKILLDRVLKLTMCLHVSLAGDLIDF